MDGSPASYTLALKSQQSAEVTVTIIADAPIVVEPQQIVFDGNNWNVPQTVTVTITANEQAAAAQVSTIRHSVKSADSAYNNVSAPSLTININEPGVGASGVFLPLITR